MCPLGYNNWSECQCTIANASNLDANSKVRHENSTDGYTATHDPL